ncbi:MAG: hypothetical protein ACK56F_07955, partial [bacterium]
FKYALRDLDPRVMRILGDVSYHSSLVSAAYAESTWKKIDCALNLVNNFCLKKGIGKSVSLSEENSTKMIHSASNCSRSAQGFQAT